MAQHFMLPLMLSVAIDEWIAEQPEPRPSRPEAIRQLIALGLAVKEGQTSSPP